MSEPKKLKLPNMNEFSPGVVGELGPLLELVAAHEGDRDGLRSAIASAIPRISATPMPQRLNRANNVLIGMSECGLFELESNKLTGIAVSLKASPSDEVRSVTFAKHLLENCHGKAILEVVGSLEARAEERTGDNIRSELRARGFRVTTNEGDASKIRQWLQRAHIIDESWKIDDSVYCQVAGVSLETESDWSALTRSQRAFLLTLRHVSGPSPRWVSAAHVKELTLAQWGPRSLPEGSFRAKIIDPLQSAGWLEARGKGTGRGGNIGEIRAGEKLISIKAELNVEHSPAGIPRDLLQRRDTPLQSIYQDLQSPETYKKGLALELLALRLCFDLGLRPTDFRKRSVKTQGAEVDLIADGLHLAYSRWIFQCKNTTAAVDLEDLAKEIGLAVLLKAHIVVMVTRGRFTREVERYARGAELETHLQVILIDGTALDQIRNYGESRLIDILKAQAREALTVKATQVREIIATSDAAGPDES